MPFDTPWLPLIIFFSRIVDVSIGTIRMICVLRGYRALAIGLAFCEVLVWTYAVAGVFSRLDNILNVVGYAAGFAAGNGLGMCIEQRLGLGVQMITLMSRRAGAAIARGLEEAGWMVTTLSGDGLHGPNSLAVAVVPRREATRVINLAHTIDPDVRYAVTDVRDNQQPGSGRAFGLPQGISAGVRPFRSRVLRFFA